MTGYLAAAASRCATIGRMSSGDDIGLWDEAAGRYAELAGVDDSFHRRLRPFLREVLGDVAGRRVLDVGCGPGWLSEQFRREGAEVAGVDGSSALVRHARAAYPHVPFTVHDLTAGLPRPLQTYHAAVAHMVLMDLPEVESLVADISASLAAGGVFVFSILHPCFFGQAPVEDTSTGERYRKVTGYLHRERRWITSFGGHHHYHRPLSWYVDLVARHRLVVTGMHEPPTLPGRLDAETEWTDYERWFATIPTMIAMACRPA